MLPKACGYNTLLNYSVMSFKDCVEYIDNITAESPYGIYHVLLLINPVDSYVWEERQDVWNYIFILYSSIYSLLFFLLGILSLVLLIKRDCIRLKTKTFFAIYTCIVIFGFSRGFHLAFDPYGVLGWIQQQFPQWTIITRALALLGFPSLTASYTLVFLTLYKSAELGQSRLWHQKWKVVIPLTAGHYTIAIIAEVIANTASYPALASVIVCDAFFTLWGLLVCIVYLFAGHRLLRKINRQFAQSVRISNSFSSEKKRRWWRQRQESQSALQDESYERQSQKISQTVRKIAIITYFTAILTIVYAVINMINLFFTLRFVFVLCFGLNGLGKPIRWLVLQGVINTIEIPLALLMIYSVTDLNIIIEKIMFKFCCYCTLKPCQTCINNSSPRPIPDPEPLPVQTGTGTEESSKINTSSTKRLIPLNFVINSSTNDLSIPV